MHAFTWWQELIINLVVSPATWIVLLILVILFVAWIGRKIWSKLKSKKS